MPKKQYPPKTIKHRTNQKYLEKYRGYVDEIDVPIKERQELVVEQEVLTMTPEKAYTEYEAQYLRSGKIKTQTLEAQKTFPVQGVKVEIFKEFPSGEYIIDTQLTDESGLTKEVELPALSSYQSTVPGLSQPFTVYDIRFTAPGYTTTIVHDVPVYEDITTFQQINMVANPITPSSIDVIEYSIKPPVV